MYNKEAKSEYNPNPSVMPEPLKKFNTVKTTVATDDFVDDSSLLDWLATNLVSMNIDRGQIEIVYRNPKGTGLARCYTGLSIDKPEMAQRSIRKVIKMAINNGHHSG